MLSPQAVGISNYCTGIHYKTEMSVSLRENHIQETLCIIPGVAN
jgi:hypothetical protein